MPPQKKHTLKAESLKRAKEEHSDSEGSMDNESETYSADGSGNDSDNDIGDDEMDLDDNEEKPKKNSSEAFSLAMNNILGSTLKGNDKKQPILARSKGAERKIEDEKLEYKARKMLAAEKKALKNKGRVIPDYTTFEYEKSLRKVATRGVVKLFNAIRTQQKVTEVAVDKATEVKKTKSAIDKAKDMSQMPKSSFLELLKSGNTTTA